MFRWTSPVPPPMVSAFENMYPLYQLRERRVFWPSRLPEQRGARYP